MRLLEGKPVEEVGVVIILLFFFFSGVENKYLNNFHSSLPPPKACQRQPSQGHLHLFCNTADYDSDSVSFWSGLASRITCAHQNVNNFSPSHRGTSVEWEYTARSTHAQSLRRIGFLMPAHNAKIKGLVLRMLKFVRKK